jgi:hypothetical protein
MLGRIRAIAVAGGLAASCAVTVAGSASAAEWPTGCSHSKIDGGATAICDSGGGQFRAVVTCNTLDGRTVTRVAPRWLRPGDGASFVFCPEFASGAIFSGVESQAG